MKLVGLDVNVVRKNVIEDYVLDKRTLIVLLIVKALDISKRYGKDVYVLYGIGIVALDENYRCALIDAGYALIRVAIKTNGVGGKRKLLSNTLLRLTDLGDIRAGNNYSVLVDNTDRSADDVLHLIYYGLK